MIEPDHRFDETLLSGYIDGELTQVDSQRVRVHLEDCAACRRTTRELRELRQATMGSAFEAPADTQWDETPRSAAARILSHSSWILAGLWIVGVVVSLLRQTWVDTESSRFDAVIGLALVSAIVFVVLSVLLDRLHVRKTDPYRKVVK